LNLVRLPRNGIHQLARMVVQEALEAGHHVRLGHMDVVAFSHARGTVPHQAGQRELVHTALGTASAERVTPAIKLESLQTSIADCFSCACWIVVK